jgi:hypothetical protein
VIRAFIINDGGSGDAAIHFELDDGPPFTVPVRGLPTSRKMREAMIKQTALSIIEHYKKEKPRFEILEVDMEAEKPTTPSLSLPPRLAEHFISFLAPKNTAQALLGDMQEMFQKNVRRLGEKEAQRLYWLEVRASAGKWILDWLMRVGFLTAIVDCFRSKFGV